MTIPTYRPSENILREMFNICIKLKKKDPKNAQYLKDNIGWLNEHIYDLEEEIEELKAILNRF